MQHFATFNVSFLTVATTADRKPPLYFPVINLICFPQKHQKFPCFLQTLSPVMFYTLVCHLIRLSHSRKTAESAWCNDVTLIRPPPNATPQLLLGEDGCRVTRLVDRDSGAQRSRLTQQLIAHPGTWPLKLKYRAWETKRRAKRI